MKPSTPLVKPGRYYREHESSLVESFTAVSLSALVVTLSLLLIGVIAAGEIHVNLAVESPLHPSDAICSQMGPIGDAITDLNGPSCTIPETTSRFVTGWKQVSAWAPLTFVGVLLAWFAVALGLHTFTELSNEGLDFTDTLSVAGWGLVPLAIEALVTLLLVMLAFAHFPTSIPMHGTFRTFQMLTVGFAGTIRFLVSLSVAVWQGYIWTYGLRHVHGLSRPRSLLAAGTVTGFLMVVAGL